ncbi:MAG: hypothetical protein PHW82_04690 [Bacteroidales bacterium]|nr:hypothetical protein [Bacteroidales bacterium]
MPTKINNAKSLFHISFIGIIIFIIHYALLYFFRRYIYAPNLLWIHPFMLSITILSIVSIKIISRKAKSQIQGYAFLFSSLFKMFLSVFFLLPVFQNDGLFRKEYIIQFFMIYFIYLIAEVFYLVRDLKNN